MDDLFGLNFVQQFDERLAHVLALAKESSREITVAELTVLVAQFHSRRVEMAERVRVKELMKKQKRQARLEYNRRWKQKNKELPDE